MTLFDVPENATTASSLSKGFLLEANQNFDSMLLAAEDLIQRFWYRNRDAEGNPSLEGDEPTGIEILQAAGTNAEKLIDIAYARVQMLVTIATELGNPGLVDLTKVANPYDLTFNPDGSLNTYTLKE